MDSAISGVVAPVITPVEEGEIRPDRVDRSVEFTLECGCHAVVAAGTGVQETSTMSLEERREVIAATVEAVDGAVPVVAGVSFPSKPGTAALLEHAAREGADAVVAMPPWGLPPSGDAIVRYFEFVASESDLPVVAYNNPTVTADMSRETMAAVAALDGVTAVKESSRDWLKIGWLLERVRHAGHADVFTTMDVLLPTLQAGGGGAIIPPPATVPAMAVHEAYEAGDLEAAAEAQRTFGTFPPDAANGLTPTVKAAAERAGVSVGPPRWPYDRLPAEAHDDLEAWMDRVDVPRYD
ncbi:dihydrodipicolinate synthase family protein [Halorarum halobium]|uniref:dihydrodipicolinate synthase family protein n=1 Tax=Halorarum halobium TaxID=3075121 RepID=UPI0028AC1ADD|nr:dihydrodipicolinate synthase family protein [Halobaculum sp. XH14]